MKYYIPLVLLVCFSITSCRFFTSDDTHDYIARVNDTYLTQDDIAHIIPAGTSKTDSLLIVKNYIDRWASNLLLMEKALLNLPDAQQNNFNTLVAQYKNDVFTKAFLDALVKRSIDTLVTPQQAQAVYAANKESFKLDDDLLQLRYISVSSNAIHVSNIKERFKRYNTTDKHYLDSIAVQFKSYSLNDSIWVRANQIIEKIPVISTNNKSQLLKKSNYIQRKDSLHLYLIQIKDVLLRNDYAPLDYVTPTVHQIVLNKRKLKLIREIEKDIIKDAIKNNQFEIYK